MGLNLDALAWLFVVSGLLHTLIAIGSAVLLWKRLAVQYRLHPSRRRLGSWLWLYLLWGVSCGMAFFAFMFAEQMFDVATLTH